MSAEAQSSGYRVITISRPKPTSSNRSSDGSQSQLTVPNSTSGDVTPGGLSDTEQIQPPPSPQPTENSDTQADVFDQLRGNVYMDSSVPLSDLISRSDYLQKYPSWLGFCGPENKKKFAPTFIARNDTIWELIFSERGYVDMLVMAHDVYMVPFPDFNPGQFDCLPANMSGTSLRDTLLPGLKELVTAHERILRPLLALHDQAENHVVESLGPLLVKLFDKDSQSDLSQLYGGFLFAQKRIREELQICKRCPLVAQFLEKCKQDPRSSRKSLEDCHMVIVQRWTKVETLLEAIIKNTLNRPSEVADLERARNSVRSLLKQAEAMMTRMEHAEKLAQFADLLHVPLGTSEDRIEARLLNEMRSTQTTLINYGPLRVTPKLAGHQTSSTVEVIGVALNTCFFMLQRIPDTGRLQLFKGTEMPAVLWWGQVYGYFRKSVEKGGFGFFILLHSNAALTLFHCSTVDELARWEQILNNGFAQWRESAPTTIEVLDLELNKSRATLAEQWQRTEAVTELLRELDRDLEQAWSARVTVCAALIRERLKLQMTERRDPVDSVDTESAASSAGPGTQSASVRSRSKASVSGSGTASAATASNSGSGRGPDRKTANSSSSAFDVLRSNTFISNPSANDALDQLFFLFQENFARLSFALVGSSSAGLSRSASDVEERKRPPTKPVRKNETFSVRDSISPLEDLLFFGDAAAARDSSISEDSSFPNVKQTKQDPSDPKMLAELGRKSKKRDAHRLSTTVASIFRSASRDKSNGPVQQQSSLDLSGSPLTATPSGKGLRTRPPPSSLSTAAPGSRSSGQISTASTPVPPRPSLSFLPGQGLAVDNLLGTTDSADGSGNGSCTSLLSQPSAEALILLRDLNRVAEEFYPLICDLRTDNVELKARVQFLQADRDALEETHRRAVQHGLHTTNCTRAGCGDAEGADFAPTLTVKQETEKLRQDYETFTRKSEEWEKERQRQRDEIEREHTKLAKERTRLDEEWAEYERRQRQYEENCKTLQQQIDLHASRGVKFTGITMPELRIPEVSVGPATPLGKDQISGSCTSLGDLESIQQGNRPTPSPIHFHSTSDDLSSKWAQPTRRNQSTSSFSTHGDNLDSTPRPSIIPSNSLHNDNLPEHLRGSLLNQSLQSSRQPSPRPECSSPDSRLVNSWSAGNPNASNSSLMKLADSSKVRPAQKPKKGSLFRIH